MSKQTPPVKLTLDAGPETDDEELEKLTRQLREELLELDVQAVEWMSGAALPANAKAGDPIT